MTRISVHEVTIAPAVQQEIDEQVAKWEAQHQVVPIAEQEALLVRLVQRLGKERPLAMTQISLFPQR